MTTYDERERAFEAAFVHDQDMRFRALARRNKALAHWVAERLGRSDAAAQAYVDDIIMFSLDHSGDDAVASRIEEDLRQGGHAVTIAEIHAEMDRQMARAIEDERTGRTSL